MQESNAKIPAQNSYVSISPYVGIIQIRFRVKASAYSQPAYASTPFSFLQHFSIVRTEFSFFRLQAPEKAVYLFASSKSFPKRYAASKAEREVRKTPMPSFFA